ncbi:IclR family transcriptional regulator [Edaphobacter albus]|uniref:IclR family transcriptional regulator n=1 Tax=Edaphobacter sp. 4G125 TaxID=2763071 RepID=UPI001646F1F5|nr:IclR family transcriptional regulator [Edaphobacter sp. 4G125]QNI36456.1 IclR family transcriptional regulator [Edaphobacter sp. 4G125]
MPKKVAQVPFIQSLDRGLTILQAVATSRQPVTLGELSELLGVDRSSAFRLAQTLRRRGFLSTPAGRKDYILGSAIWTLSRQYDWSNMLVRVAHQELKALAQGLNETAHLAIREGRSALFIDSVHAHHVIVVAGQTGELVPLYATAHGKALLADLGEKELHHIFGADSLQKFTKTTIKTIPALSRECVTIRDHGYATDDAEYMEGIRCVAAPIRLNTGMIVGSIGISAPASRFLKEHYPSHSKLVMLCAKKIGQLLSVSDEVSEQSA